MLCNYSGKTLPRLQLFLNPGLRLTSMKEGDKELAYERDHQVLLIDRPLETGDSVRLNLTYEGTIDERVCYLEVPDSLYYDTRRNDSFFHFGRRYACVSNAFLLLVPENIWYPVAIPPVNLNAPWLSTKDFTRYSLDVINPVQSTLLSQGPSRKKGDTLRFEPPFPLDGISISGGEYERFTLKLKSCDFDLYYFRGNDMVSEVLKDIKPEEMSDFFEQKIADLQWHTKIASSKSLFNGIAEMMMRQDWCGYPSSRLIVAETPLPFISHFREWMGKSEFVQSGLVLFSERGAGMNVPDYRWILKQNANNAARRSSYTLDPKIEKSFKTSSLLRPFIDCFLSKTVLYYNNQNLFFNRFVPNRSRSVYFTFRNLFDCYTLFREPQSYIYSVDYSTVDLLLKTILKAQAQFENIYQEVDIVEYAAQVYLLNHSLEEAMKDKTLDSDVLCMIFQMEAESLLNHVTVDIPIGDFYKFLNDFYKQNQGVVPLERFTSDFGKRFGVDFAEVWKEWNSKSPTRFQIKDMEINQVVVEGKRQGTRMRFKIKNAGNSKGLVSVLYTELMERKVYNFYLHPGECKEVKIRKDHIGEFRINTGISYHIPGKMANVRSAFGTMSDDVTSDTTSGLFDIRPDEFLAEPGEIIVDNEDPGFRLIEPDRTFFQRLFENESKKNTIETNLGLGFPRWQKVLSIDYFGDSIRSAYCKECKSGKYKAEWKAFIPEEGSYEVFVLLPKIPSNYHYTVYYGQEEQEVWAKTTGWSSLGTYDFPKGEARVVLDDRRLEDKRDFYVIADAVKWVKVD